MYLRPFKMKPKYLFGRESIQIALSRSNLSLSNKKPKEKYRLSVSVCSMMQTILDLTHRYYFKVMVKIIFTFRFAILETKHKYFNK